MSLFQINTQNLKNYLTKCLPKTEILIQLIHGGEARDLKLEIPGTPPTVRIYIYLIFSLIMVGFAWVFFADNLKKCTKTTYLNGFLEK